MNAITFVTLKIKLVLYRKLELEIQSVDSFENLKQHFINQGVVMQRAVHIIMKLLNICLGSTIVVLLIGLGICQVMSAFILINPHNAELTPIPLKLVYAVITCFVFPILVIAYGFAGNFYDDSVKLLQELKRKAKLSYLKQPKQRKVYEKFIASCQVQKIEFGVTNFIDKLTPLVFQKFCIDRIIDLVLVQK